MARPDPAHSESATAVPANVELAVRLLEAHNAPKKVEAALVYRGCTKQSARELVEGLLSGRIKSPPTDHDEHVAKDWATLPAPYVLAFGLVVLSVTVAIAAAGRRVYLIGLIGGLLISCAGLQSLVGPKRRRLSIALCLLLIVLATAAARFLHLPP